VQIVNLRLRMTAAGEPYTPRPHEMRSGDGSAALDGERKIFFDGEFLDSRLYRRERLRAGDVIEGPAMITEYTSATIVPPGCRATVDAFENLVIAVGEQRA
jgi:N-methylhydantoinase A